MNGTDEDLVHVIKDSVSSIEAADLIEAADPSTSIMRKQAVWASLAPGLLLLAVAIAAEFLDENMMARILSIVGTLATGGGGMVARRSVYSVDSFEIKIAAERERATAQVAARLEEEATKAGARFESQLEQGSFDDVFLSEDEQGLQWEGDLAPDLSALRLDDEGV